MRVDVLTLFPGMFAPMHESMMWKAQDRGFLELATHDIRAWTTDRHRTVDDTPYGGGGGMVLKVDILTPAIEAVRGESDAPVILMSPQGRVLTHSIAQELSQHEHMVIVCGHYEGFDERIRELVVTDEISIGDYVLTSGELAAMVVIDSVVRLLPGVLGAEGGAERDSHADGLLEYPHYTRPAEYRGLGVPDILKSGNHGAVDLWRREQALRRTWEKRPDLLASAALSDKERALIAKWEEQASAENMTKNMTND